MGTKYNPRIISNGLTVYLDAANTRSYAGSGFTVNPLVGGIGGTLINGIGFSSQNNGSFFYDGSDDYFRFPLNFFVHDSGTPFTVSVWFKTATSGMIFGQENGATPGAGGGWVPAIYVDTNGKIRTSCFWGGSTTNQSISSASVNDNLWHQITVTFESTSHKSFLDGILFDTISKTQTFYSATYYYYLGSGKNTSWPSVGNMTLSGNISNFLFYNRALTAQEVLQNYNATKKRYV
jgi:hypothetical protein